MVEQVDTRNQGTFVTRGIWPVEEAEAFRQIAEGFNISVKVLGKEGEGYTHIVRNKVTGEDRPSQKVIPEGSVYLQLACAPGQDLGPFYEKAQEILGNSRRKV
ncbi:hypothetical protein HYS90_00110 [Candidatus Curtissbacteria bacterium]|nr:hypothetical protein [Candidatus Curtissbacteria bacterium]MBI2599065.1 hypothetical protein [Candidatus Curtissbacteria bacterium]